MKLKLKEAHKYWKNPPFENSPAQYTFGKSRSDNLARLIEATCKKNDSILELGCNIGRNLLSLEEFGFTDLRGIDICEEAILNNIVPSAKLMVSSIEDMLPQIPDKRFDVVFSMATLMHIPYESEWIMWDIARITKKFLIIIEKEEFINIERIVQDRCYERDYLVFRMFGFKEVYMDDGKSVPGYITRVFKRK